MSQMVWFVLKDGRSLIACCSGVSPQTLEQALAEPEGVVTLTDDQAVTSLQTSEIRDFLVFDSQVRLPLNLALYQFTGV